MKKTLTRILNFLILGAIFAILYIFIGRGYVEFDSAEVLKLAAEINKQCNDDGSCPARLDGWAVLREGKAELKKGPMIYYPVPVDEGVNSQKHTEYKSFRLVYGFFLPDNWFEAQGGVDKPLTSGWENR